MPTNFYAGMMKLPGISNKSCLKGQGMDVCQPIELVEEVLNELQAMGVIDT